MISASSLEVNKTIFDPIPWNLSDYLQLQNAYNRQFFIIIITIYN